MHGEILSPGGYLLTTDLDWVRRSGSNTSLPNPSLV